MRKELVELRKLNNQIKSELNHIKSLQDGTISDINLVKALKNKLFEKTSKIFIYNLKKLIQLESTQRSLAKKIGVSEDLLSKYKSGEAFPSIETLIYISEVYDISISKLINTPLTATDIDNLENYKDEECNFFEKKYYVYFLVTNISKEGAIHEGVIEISGNNVAFKILYNDTIVKNFIGSYDSSDKLIYFSLHSAEDGNAYINMSRPNVNKNKYVGGLAMLLLGSDANSKPCAQKILFSKVRLDRELYYDKLSGLLNFYKQDVCFGNIKISYAEDEAAYNFIGKLLYSNQ